ncbi:haloacid dehalogenase-like hydrolase domain-containing protein 2 [Syncephalastrum racemosum]|uniref:Phospholysine phosphohistidine inorganic pyrophosphate phosphatase n=1 Tax=Syncephalastrum racemosum TaxID=13706 RepID=A0A1X2HV59_SYNRA|nr:haloacid dehalogenase-like hydrolase domain-containing protein 2 [Syncephalastrum racemosum]
MGFEVREHEIFTSLSACRDKVASQNLRPFLLMEDAAMDEFKDLDTSNPNAVVVGLAPSKFDYAHMNKAFRLLTEDKSRPLIAVHKAMYFADADEELSMGPGGFVEALEYATGVKSTVVGKPTRSFFQLALTQIGLQDTPQNVAIIGDDVNNDLGGGAKELGLHRFLVRTGKYRPGDEASHKDDRLHVYESIAEAINDILSQIK